MKFAQRQLKRVAKHERERKHVRKILKADIAIAYHKVEKDNRFNGLKAMLRRIIQAGRRNIIEARVLRREVKQKAAAKLRKEKLEKN